MLSCRKRLRSEIANLKKATDENITLEVDEEDIRRWRATVEGPPDSPFDGFAFELDLQVGENYPLAPPLIRMLTKCFHPNIHFSTGEVCLDIIKKEWTPAWSQQSACRAIVCLLGDPAADSPLNCDAGNMIRAGDYVAYRSMARMYAVEFAKNLKTPTEVDQSETH